MKRILQIILISIMLCVGVFTLVGCSEKDEETSSSKGNKTSQSSKNEEDEDIDEKSDKEDDEYDEDDSDDKKTQDDDKDDKIKDNDDDEKEDDDDEDIKDDEDDEEDKKETAKPVDKTPVDIKNNSSYYFVINGKKYNAGDKISDLSESKLHLNKTASEKELQTYGYLIGGNSVLNTDNKTVLSVTPFNGTKTKVKSADASIGGVYISKYNYESLDGKVEITNGITIGTSIEDVKAIFGQPTKITEPYTEYYGPTYSYEVTGEYKSFVFGFDKDGKVESIRWTCYIMEE